MNARIGALRKRMARAHAHVALEKMADDWCIEWYTAAANRKTLPDPNGFVLRVVAAGFRLPTFGPVMVYLDDCRSKNKEPDPERLFRALLPRASRG